MTDAEIIKALKCSVKDKCPECPYFHSYPCDKCRNMQTDALDLINRLQEEKQNLEVELKAMRGAANSYKAENERLDKNLETETNHITRLENQIERLLSRLETIKAEAYKEFAELLCKIWQRYEDENISGIYVPKWVMFVYKELVGDTDES